MARHGPRHIIKRSFDIIQPDVSLCGGIGEVRSSPRWPVCSASSPAALLGRCDHHRGDPPGPLAVSAALTRLQDGRRAMMEFDVYENRSATRSSQEFELKKGLLRRATARVWASGSTRTCEAVREKIARRVTSPTRQQGFSLLARRAGY